VTYQSLYRRFRPQTFAQVRGQQHLVQALRNAVREDRVGHAYLFSGPRGTGKTTTARILAKALNCPEVVDGEPCDRCESCRAITEGRSLDVFELDAASNNGVDAIRDLTDRASQGSPGRRKVYILDEVHMLSAAASNALLKTLEEPPGHVVFVLATTDPQKVLPTIRSRTQHFEVHLLSADELGALVDDVIAEAELDVPPGTRDYVLREGGGSARDTLSALDRVVAIGGIPDQGDTLDDLVDALCDRDTAMALSAVDRAVRTGRGPRTLGELLMARLRDVFLAAVGADLDRLSDDQRVRVTEQARRLGARGATTALDLLAEAFTGIADAPDPRIPLEVALVRLTRPDLDRTLGGLAARVEQLERLLAGGVPSPGSHPGGPEAARNPASPPTDSATGAAAGSAAPATRPGDGDGGVDTTAVDDADRFPEDPDGPGHPATATPERFPTDPDAPGAPGPAPSGHGAADAARQALASSRATRPGRAGAASPPTGASVDSMADAAAGPPPTPRRAASSAQSGPRSENGVAASAGVARPAEPSAPSEPPAAPARPSEPEAPAAPDTLATGDLPSRDDLVVAWGDAVLPTLPQKAKVRFAGGRFVDVADGVAVFGLPNEVHRVRCEEVRPQVEQVLASHFGRPVPLRLVVDDGAPPPRIPGVRTTPVAGDADGAPDDDSIDVSELVDATDAPTTEIDRITEVFGAVEVVHEEDPA
jgi:DNA polymerase-3 subunit gamma/tau